MAFNNNNRPQVDYLLVKQLIVDLKDSSFLNNIRVGLREYNADNLGEKDIVDTVKHTASNDLILYENLLSEFRDIFSTFRGVDNLYDGLVMSSQQTNYASSSTENASSDMKIFAYPEHQSPLQQIVAQIESEVDQQMETEFSIPVSPTTLKVDAEPFTPKGKG
ncbi:unnamed protein product [Rhizophagus irregularis]|uniref:Uncharacterized protein n=1 Tax=Rhizophagus irregularis TaxID=588596 RepID=A0A2I1GZS2_9GLOM|nr:hypothetical protein RhiirA4_469577 [Rhizophagus irregularis]CAB4405529.1 unnamed protein product [Rhizophagus irregularis]